MINLLPITRKEEIRKNYLYKLAVFGSVFLGVAAVSFGILLSSFYMLLRIDKNEIESLLQDTDEKKALNVNRKILNDTRNKLNVLGFETGELLVTDAVGLLLKSKNDGIRINEISYTKSQIPGQISIKGIADTREGFLEFTKSLRKEEKFSDAQSPISDLSKSENIEFTIMIHIKTDEQAE